MYEASCAKQQESIELISEAWTHSKSSNNPLKAAIEGLKRCQEILIKWSKNVKNFERNY